MTTKVLTVRIPALVYSTLCQEAGELGVPIASHVRRLIEREHEVHQIDELRREIVAKLAELAPATNAGAPSTAATLEEILLLAREIAAHANPQLVSQVHAKLAHRGVQVRA